MADSSNPDTVGRGVLGSAGRNSLVTKKEAEASFNSERPKPLSIPLVTDYSAASATTSAFGALAAFGAGAGFSSLTTGAVTTAVGAPSPTIRFSSVV